MRAWRLYLKQHPEDAAALRRKEFTNPIHFTGSYVNGIVEAMAEQVPKLAAFAHVPKRGFQCTGILDQFFDWLEDGGHLFASRPVARGRDGAQKLSNTLIQWVPGFTWSDFEQVHGRVYRRGSGFKEVWVVIPIIEGCRYDIERLRRIKNRKTTAKFLQDGETPASLVARIADFDCEEAKVTILEQMDCDPLTRLRPPATPPPMPDTHTPSRTDSQYIRSQWSRSGGDHVRQRMDEGRFKVRGRMVTDEEIAAIENEWSESWRVQHGATPQERFIEEAIMPFPERRACIVGCGSASLPSENLPNPMTLVDLFISHPRVQKRNMTRTGLGDNSVDVVGAILSIYREDMEAALREAHRVLDHGGELWVAKTCTNATDPFYLQNIPLILKDLGFRNPQGSRGFKHDVWDGEFQVFRAIRP
jgi:SAM-dependent methyltransferase